MITKQRLYHDGDNIVLRNTVDCSAEINAARQVNEIDNGGWFGPKHERMQLMGFIPPEFWNFDPWLIVAKRAQREGDMATYMKNMKKFFEVHKAFKVNHKRTVWNGCEAVLL